MFGPNYRIFKVCSLFFLALGMYFLSRVEFFLWNFKAFGGAGPVDVVWAFINGMRFDISAILILMAPIVLLTLLPLMERFESVWRFLVFVIFMVTQLPLFIVNLGDAELINFVGRRFTFDSLFLVNEIPGKILNFVTSYWILFLVNTVLVLYFILRSYKIICFDEHKNKFSLKFNVKPTWFFFSDTLLRRAWLGFSVLAFLLLAVSVVGIRGGFQGKPLHFVNANIFGSPMLNNLVLNSSFTFLKSYGTKGISSEKYFNEPQEMLAHLNGSLSGSLLEDRPRAPQNVVIIVLESFGEEYIGANEVGKSYTPFLDTLKEKGLSFNNSFANGRRSIEGIAAILGSIPALMNEPFISSHYTANKFLGLGSYLDESYESHFFHGGRNGTMYFDSFTPSAGIKQYFGASEYPRPEDDDGIWGIWDEPFLQWMAAKLEESKKPFVSTVFTLSSHQPFKVPSKYAQTFLEGPLPILKSVEYADFALKEFFAAIEKKDWYANTLFIITADHTSLHYRPQYDNEQGDYRIPMILFHPNFKLPVVDTNQIVQQIDIMPTVLDFLNIPVVEKNYLGSSMFIPGQKVAVNFIDGRYILVGQEYSLRWYPGQASEELFKSSDWKFAESLVGPEYDAVKAEVLLKLKAQMQYFNEGMQDNKLYYP